jgi:HK97 family phage portal protein
MPVAPVAANPYGWLKSWLPFKKNTPRLEQKHAYSASLGSRAYMVSPGQAVWMDRDYGKFAQEAYMRNVVAYRCINLITQAASTVSVKARSKNSRGVNRELLQHPLLDLVGKPNPITTQSEFFTSIYHYRLIGGNAFVLAVAPTGENPKELHILRPDRMAVIAGKNGLPQGYRYTVNGKSKDYSVNTVTGQSAVLHIKNFHPLNDWYGLSPVEAAAYSIDQHNHSAAWNQALLQNGARPSGALVVKLSEGGTGHLSEEQYGRIKTQIDEQFSGAANAGRPLLLEGGLDWKEMSLTPKDMDFIECKHSSARDIALAFGVPPQMLGIPGDNTYSNLQEARLSLWEQTIMPLVDSTLDALNEWLAPKFDSNIELVASTENVSALAVRNQVIWDRLEKASFLTEDEKRAAVGYGAKK